MAYEFENPNEHLFVPVPHQTGCARCGYARGHHPTKRQLRQLTGPVIHFATREDADELVHMGPAICGAGAANRNEQYVTGIYNNATCRSCIGIVQRINRQRGE